MAIPLDIMTEKLSEPNEEVNASEYASDLRDKLRSMYELVRNHLQKASLRQKKQYDCRVKEHNYSVGDHVWRNQWQSPPGLKAGIRRHWTGPWMVTEKLCDVLFRLKHSADSPSVVIHGDNMKLYHGEQKLYIQVPPTQVTDIRFPDITEFTNVQTNECLQCMHNDQREENIPLNSENRSTFQGNNTGKDHAVLQPIQRKFTQLGICDTQSGATGTNQTNSSVNVGHDHMLKHSVMGSPSVNKQSFSNGLQIHSPGNLITPLAEQLDSRRSNTSMPKQLAEQLESRRLNAPIPDQLAEQNDNYVQNFRKESSSKILTPVAEQQQYTRSARVSGGKQLAEQNVQNFRSKLCSVSISSQTFRQSRRVPKTPAYLRDYVLLCSIMFQCDTCGKFCAYKRNLVRHVKDVHSSTAEEYWNCPALRCASHFIRRSSLTKHLMKSHGYDKFTASMKAVNAQRGDRLEYYEAEVEDVSADDSILDLLNDIQDWESVYPTTDQNNNTMFDVSDLEDISDGDLLDVNVLVCGRVSKGLGMQELGDNSSVSAMDDNAVSKSVIDSGDSNTETVEGDVTLDYEDDIMINDDDCVHDGNGVNDGDNVDGDNPINGADSVNSDDNDGVYDSNGVNGGDSVDGDNGISGEYSVNGDGDDENMFTGEKDTDHESFITISDDDVNEDQTVAIPEFTRIVQTLTLTLRRTITYSQGVKINEETEYLWEGNQSNTTM